MGLRCNAMRCFLPSCSRVQVKRVTVDPRQKFVDACHSYIGVPYSKKGSGTNPEDEDYGAPLSRRAACGARLSSRSVGNATHV